MNIIIKVIKYFLYTLIIITSLSLLTLVLVSYYDKNIPANYLKPYIEKRINNMYFETKNIFINLKKIGSLEIILNDIKIKKEENKVSAQKVTLTIPIIRLINQTNYLDKIHAYQTEIYLVSKKNILEQDPTIIDLLKNFNTKISSLILEQSRIIVNNENKDHLFGNITLLSAHITKKHDSYTINSDIQGKINDRKINLSSQIVKIQDDLDVTLNFQHFDSDLLNYVVSENEILKDLHFHSKAEIRSKLNIKEDIQHKESSIKIISAYGDFFNKKYFSNRQEFRGNVEAALFGDSLSIKNASINFNNINILINGKVNLTNRDNNINLNIDAKDLDVEKIYKCWPINWSKKTRDWFHNSITKGKIKNMQGKVIIDNDEIKFADIISNIKEVNLIASDDIKIIEDIEGTLHFSENNINLNVEKAKISKLNVKGDVNINNINSPEVSVEIKGSANGMIDGVIDIYPKLKEKIGINLSNIKEEGVIRGDFYFDIPIFDPDEIKTKLDIILEDIEIENIEIPNIIENIAFYIDMFEINHQNGHSVINGKGKLDDLDIELKVTKDEDKIIYSIKGEIFSKYFENINILKDIKGIIGLDVNGVKDDKNDIQFILDITDASFFIDDFNINKKQGDNGRVNLKLYLKDDYIYIKELYVDTESLKIDNLRGVISGEEYSFNIQNLYSENNNFSLITSKDKSNYLLEIYGKNIDISQLNILKKLKSENSPHKNKILLLLDKITMKNKVEINDLIFDLEFSEQGYKSGYLKAKIDNDYNIYSRYKDDKIELNTDNAGLLLKAIDVSSTINKGSMDLYINLKDECTGSIVVNDFILTKAPILAKVLTIASFGGLVNTLDGKGIEFRKLYIPFNYSNNIISTERSLAEGVSLGIITIGTINLEKNTANLKGTIIPFYMINQSIEKIPLIGKIITGGEGKGLIFGTDYSLIGDINNPLITANPLTTFAPGFLRKIFSIIK